MYLMMPVLPVICPCKVMFFGLNGNQVSRSLFKSPLN